MPGTNPFEQLSLDALRRRSSIKWRAHPDDVLPLWVAEMDVLLAEPVVRAICDAAARGDTGYPAGTAYAEALSDFAAQCWSWDGLDVRRTALVPDVMMGIVEVLRLITAPGAAVVVNSPVYPPFYSFVEHMDRRIIEAPLAPDARIDFVALDRAFGAAAATGPAAFLLCNPHNPTGTVHSPGELAAVAKLAGSHRVRVVADEIHGPLVLGGARFTPYLSVPDAASGFAVLSASKAWNLAGLKAAVAVAGEDAAADLARMPEEVSHGASHVGVLAHTAALQSGREWLDTVLAGLNDNRELLGALLGQYLPAVSWTPPQATALAWLDCTALGLNGQAPDDDARGNVSASTGPAAAFLERGRVALSSGAAFGTGGAGHVRLNFATSPAILTEAVQRMGAVAASIAR